jgi:hypothetical protein
VVLAVLQGRSAVFTLGSEVAGSEETTMSFNYLTNTKQGDNIPWTGAKHGERNFSRFVNLFVEVAVPPGSFGTRLDAMYEFHARHGIKPQRMRGEYANGAVIRWCFVDPKIARAFAEEFK